MSIANKGNTNIEYERKLNELENLINSLTERITTLETWRLTGLTDSAHQVYDGVGNHKDLTVTDGLITNIET